MGEEDRYKRDFKVTGGLWDAYKFYKLKYPKSVIDRSTYVSICQLFNKRISDKIIRESTEYRLPFKLGFLRIKSFKAAIKIKNNKIVSTRNYVNWAKTLELWERLYNTRDRSILRTIPDKKLVYHLNEHTNGYSMKWLWDRRGCNIINNRTYIFTPVKGGITKEGYHYGRKGLAAWIVNEDRTNEYFL